MDQRGANVMFEKTKDKCTSCNRISMIEAVNNLGRFCTNVCMENCNLERLPEYLPDSMTLIRSTDDDDEKLEVIEETPSKASRLMSMLYAALSFSKVKKIMDDILDEDMLDLYWDKTKGVITYSKYKMQISLYDQMATLYQLRQIIYGRAGKKSSLAITETLGFINSCTSNFDPETLNMLLIFLEEDKGFLYPGTVINYTIQLLKAKKNLMGNFGPFDKIDTESAEAISDAQDDAIGKCIDLFVNYKETPEKICFNELVEWGEDESANSYMSILTMKPLEAFNTSVIALHYDLDGIIVRLKIPVMLGAPHLDSSNFARLRRILNEKLSLNSHFDYWFFSVSQSKKSNQKYHIIDDESNLKDYTLDKRHHIYLAQVIPGSFSGKMLFSESAPDSRPDHFITFMVDMPKDIGELSFYIIRTCLKNVSTELVEANFESALDKFRDSIDQEYTLERFPKGMMAMHMPKQANGTLEVTLPQTPIIYNISCDFELPERRPAVIVPYKDENDIMIDYSLEEVLMCMYDLVGYSEAIQKEKVGPYILILDCYQCIRPEFVDILLQTIAGESVLLSGRSFKHKLKLIGFEMIHGHSNYEMYLYRESDVVFTNQQGEVEIDFDILEPMDISKIYYELQMDED